MPETAPRNIYRRMEDAISVVERERAASGVEILRAIDAIGPPPEPLDPNQSVSLINNAMSLAQKLAMKARLPELVSLLNGPWGSVILQASWRPEEINPALAQAGDAAIPVFELLREKGVRLTRFPKPPRDPKERGFYFIEPLTKCISGRQGRRGGDALLDYLFERVQHELREEPENLSAALAHFAHAALTGSHKHAKKIVAGAIKADPVFWASAVNPDRPSQNAVTACFASERYALADAMLNAAPEAAKAGLEPERCVYLGDALKSYELMKKHGVAMNLEATLSSACVSRKPEGRVIARDLMRRGADPRAPGGRLDDTTPIGYAIGNWALADLREILGAQPIDLVRSMSKSSSQGEGEVHTLAYSLRDYRGSVEDGASNDERMAELIRFAASDGSLDAACIKACIKGSIDGGMPKCLAVVAPLAKAAGVSWGVEEYARILGSTPLGDATETGRIECIRLAPSFGVDLNAPFMWSRYGGPPESMTLMGRALHAMMENDDGRSNYFEPCAKKAIALSEAGADPSFRVDGACLWERPNAWNEIAEPTREVIAIMRANHDALTLAKVTSQPTQASARRGPRV